MSSIPNIFKRKNSIQLANGETAILYARLGEPDDEEPQLQTHTRFAYSIPVAKGLAMDDEVKLQIDKEIEEAALSLKMKYDDYHPISKRLFNLEEFRKTVQDAGWVVDSHDGEIGKVERKATENPAILNSAVWIAAPEADAFRLIAAYYDKHNRPKYL